MITRFNKYQKLLEDEMIQPMSAGSGSSWIEKESLNKGAISNFFARKSKAKADATATPEIKDEKISTEVKTEEKVDQYSELLTNTPILNMSAKAYANLNGFTQEGKELDLDLDGNLTEDSAMIDIAYKYYIKNITDIIMDIQDAPTNYMVEEVSQDVVVKLNNNPVTIGTLIGGALTEWFASKQPINNLNGSLESAYISSKEGLRESFGIEMYPLNEGRGTKFITNLVSKYQKLDKGSGFASSLTKGKFGSAFSGYSPVSRKAGMNLSSTLGSGSPTMSNPSITKAISTKIPKSLDDVKNVASKITGGSKASKAGALSGIGDSIKRRTSGINNKILSAKGLFKSNVISKTIGLTTLFFLPSFIMNKVLGEWLRFFDSPKTGEENVTDFLMAFEEDMVTRDYSPFKIYRNIYKDYQFNLNKYGDNFKEIVVGWCESLYEAKIIDNQIFDICQRQIKSDVFEMYLKESSYISKELSSYLENKWQNNITFPTPALTTFSTIVMFMSLLERFEDQFYEGKIPIELPKELSEIKRFDKEGNERDYLTIGDSGQDVIILQDMLKMLGMYKGESDGVYDEEMSDLIEDVKQRAKVSNPDVIVNGNADNEALDYIEKFLILKSQKVQGNIGGRISSQKQELRSQAANLLDDR